MLPYITVHTVPVTQEDLVTLLSQANPLTSTLSQTAQQALHPLGNQRDFIVSGIVEISMQLIIAMATCALISGS